MIAAQPCAVDHYYRYFHETAWKNIEEASSEEQADIGVSHMRQLSEMDRKQNPNQQTNQKTQQNPTLKDSIWLRKQKFTWQTSPSWLAKIEEKICRRVFKNNQNMFLPVVENLPTHEAQEKNHSHVHWPPTCFPTRNLWTSEQCHWLKACIWPYVYLHWSIFA